MPKMSNYCFKNYFRNLNMICQYKKKLRNVNTLSHSLLALLLQPCSENVACGEDIKRHKQLILT